jgi:hypothetical protein
MQSTFVWHGNAHFWYCTLQWWVPQGTSFVQATKLIGPGTAIWADPDGAAAGAGGGAGAGTGAGAGVGAGATAIGAGWAVACGGGWGYGA